MFIKSAIISLLPSCGGELNAYGYSVKRSYKIIMLNGISQNSNSIFSINPNVAKISIIDA
jgi:hypothetical protein